MKDLKILAISGSPRGKEISVTSKILEKTQDSICKHYKNMDFDWEIIYLSQCKINMCEGCMGCFRKGVCHIDDEFEIIKRKMKLADVLIIASPVFFHNVTGLFKNFIDRTSYYAHYFGLIGKYGITYSVSSTNGNEDVNIYLKKYFDYLGIGTVAQISILDKIDNEDIMSYKVDFAVEKLLDVLSKKRKIDFIFQEDIFKYYKRMYEMMTDAGEFSYEGKVWTKQFGEQFDSFEEAFIFYSKAISYDAKR